MVKRLSEEDRIEWINRLNRIKKIDNLKSLRENLATGMYFRRERQWKIFSWSSSIFTALIVGFLIRGQNEALNAASFRWIISGVAVIIASISTIRIQRDYTQAIFRADLISEIDRKLTVWIGDLEKDYVQKEWNLSNRLIIWILCIFLIILVWAGELFSISK